jgi:TolA-binding protein
VKSRLVTAFAGSALLVLASTSTLAQRPAPTPEQRIDRLEKEVQQMQRQVFPKGRPADTAGFSDEPAATQSSVITLDQRIDALEHQMSDLVRQSEENGNRLRTVESGLTQMRTDQEQRLSTLEQRMTEAATAAPPQAANEPPVAAVPTTKPKPAAAKPAAPKPAAPKATPPKATGDAGVSEPPSATLAPASDPGEVAYTEGFRLWEAGQYDEAITALRAFTSAYPKHRRASYANNLIGRALLDKGEPRAAAEALLANYRNNPAGERAPDSLFYLGQALMKLGQPGQACKAYGELDAVYGGKVRPDLMKLEADAKAQAQCS